MLFFSPLFDSRAVGFSEGKMLFKDKKHRNIETYFVQ
jgi:hypothetical protein